jgi:outer membrane receptor for ferrienterochelin and colicins
MKTIILSLVLIIVGISFVSCALYAPKIIETPKCSIEGYVINNDTHKPVADVAILVEGTKLGAMSDSLGCFCVPSVPPGRYTLRISAVGFRTEHVERVIVPSAPGVPYSVRLTPITLEIDGGGSVLIGGH